jgi:1,4-dihydroxy-2-naphthoyl-CoA synthase
MTTTPTEKKESKQPKQLPAPNSDFDEFAQTLPAEELAIVKRVREYMEELGLVTRVLPDQDVLATATETARKLAQKPRDALRACKRFTKACSREQIEQAIKTENEEFALRVRSAEAKEAFTAFIEKRATDFTKISESATAK